VRGVLGIEGVFALSDLTLAEISEIVEVSFAAAGVKPIAISFREFPNETMIIVEVSHGDLEAAIGQSSTIEGRLPPRHLVVVRKAAESSTPPRSVTSVLDPAVSRLVELLNERSRTSEQQPSLDYIKDAAENLRVALTRRHHIIFGRRGVGKTALLLECKRQVESRRAVTSWVNMQILRGLDARRAFLVVVQRICEIAPVVHSQKPVAPISVKSAKFIADKCALLQGQRTILRRDISNLVPSVQEYINLICNEIGNDLFLFIDDLHYMSMSEQPYFLDLVHGITRDTSAWLKIAGIRNQCRVYSGNPPMGLQIGHDAADIPLDITLEEPKKAREFLTSVLNTYISASGIANRSGFLASNAVDRLVLSSGG